MLKEVHILLNLTPIIVNANMTRSVSFNVAVKYDTFSGIKNKMSLYSLNFWSYLFFNYLSRLLILKLELQVVEFCIKLEGLKKIF